MSILESKLITGIKGGLFVCIAVFCSGCLEQDYGIKQSISQALQTPGVSSSPGPIVCDPFSTSPKSSSISGLKARMFYYDAQDLQTSSPNFTTDFVRSAHVSGTDFYFNDLNVPTRSFSQGFTLRDGTAVAKPDGTELFEYFSFAFTTSIKLPEGTGSKKKQFALLSDDGSILSVQDPLSSAWSTNVDNDGGHASKLSCGTQAISLSSEYYTPLKISYFQGPRYSIALILIWRDWDGTPAGLAEPWCASGQSGDNVFFNSNVSPSAPLAPWTDILSRWEVVPSNVFYLDGTSANPCNSR